MPDSTSLPAAAVADTIIRTVELGVTITDAALDGEATVVFCTLIDDGQHSCPDCGDEGRYGERDEPVARCARASFVIRAVGHVALWVRGGAGL